VYHSTVLPEPTETSTASAEIGTETLARDTSHAAPALSRRRAAAEVLLCSGYPTQLLIIGVLGALGIRPTEDGALSPTFIFAVSAIDTVLLLGLVFAFLALSRERARDVFLRQGRPLDEIGVGVLLLPAIFVIVVLVQVAVRSFAPYLRNVEVSPFASLLSSPGLLAGFIALVLIAGGVREELQRAFLLHRFEQRLGGGRLGIALTSVAFGLGHTVQGWDAALITAMMGAFWGAIYLARRNVLCTVTNHALFNLTQIALGYATLTRA
jgi:membrane protease YdiL (CAAX protease family)